MTAQLPKLPAERSLRATVLAVDDLYLPKAERRRLAADVSPLLATRGVPGTHDVGLGLEVIDALGRAGEIALPSFDKSIARPAGGSTAAHNRP